MDELEPNHIAYYTGEGGVVIRGPHGMCVMPPSQATRIHQLDAQGEISGEVPIGKGTLKGGASAQLGTKLLFEQSQANLFLQFSLYRLCEMWANGQLSQEMYQSMAKDIIQQTHTMLQTELKRAEEATEKAKAAAEEAKAKAEKAETVKASVEAATIDRALEAAPKTTPPPAPRKTPSDDD